MKYYLYYFLLFWHYILYITVLFGKFEKSLRSSPDWIAVIYCIVFFFLFDNWNEKLSVSKAKGEFFKLKFIGFFILFLRNFEKISWYRLMVWYVFFNKVNSYTFLQIYFFYEYVWRLENLINVKMLYFVIISLYIHALFPNSK